VDQALEPDSGLVWQALSDPTRRRILDLLRERPRITGEIAGQFEISRIAVMRHLEVLSAAGVVTSRKRGRERWHYLNAIPLQRMYERWVDVRSQTWASSLLRLGNAAESRAARLSTRQPDVDVALEVSIAAPASEVFAALTKDPGGWWGHPYLHSDTTGLTLEPHLGGLVIESWAQGGAVLATVTRWTDDRHLELTGPFHLGVAIGIAAFELSPIEGGTNLQFTFRAFGAIDPQLVARFSEGWTELVARRLKTLVETGKRLGVAPDPPT
jgi:DNA-binding transcriptional ArsR family regulator/uncharacterized protein YndB with AHSA1/START domain